MTGIVQRYTEANNGTKKLFDEFAAKHPLEGRCSTPKEQAEVVVFLASDRASFVTGECTRVDGAISLGCFT